MQGSSTEKLHALIASHYCASFSVRLLLLWGCSAGCEAIFDMNTPIMRMVYKALILPLITALPDFGVLARPCGLGMSSIDRGRSVSPCVTRGVLLVLIFGFTAAIGVACLATGVSCLVRGVHCLAAGVPCLVTGVPCLAMGVPCTASGVHCLVMGVPCLASGVRCLAMGVPSLATGVPCLATGVPCLDLVTLPGDAASVNANLLMGVQSALCNCKDSLGLLGMKGWERGVPWRLPGLLFGLLPGVWLVLLRNAALSGEPAGIKITIQRMSILSQKKEKKRKEMKKVNSYYNYLIISMKFVKLATKRFPFSRVCTSWIAKFTCWEQPIAIMHNAAWTSYFAYVLYTHTKGHVCSFFTHHCARKRKPTWPSFEKVMRVTSHDRGGFRICKKGGSGWLI